ncbi:MAG: serine/threonine protein kinase [Candidatus Eisenbacteria bacterium]|uniref:non-specific serine/threonine protein kinase n=1 Tax=Eiseniibacteriota bacterium TaxID=2212470 RepID=A0A956LYN9_UNCEI|nr:serine/threonine protein kinase [Candidatus Eisenbacteria bacterium]
MEVGSTIGHYEVLAKLGQGGMGVVYKARDRQLDRPVALKVLPPDLTRDEERRRRFLQEAKAASAVNHPAIAQIYGIETEGDVSFIAMEFIDGSTVRQLLERDELDVLSAIEIGILVGGGLARAHEAGIVHRDIKSDNIMVTRDGHPKVLDFGLAKLVDVGSEDGTDATVLMTQVGAVMGTASYMSPEQARGLAADHRSDIFSFGIVLYEMATGKLPFQGKSALDTMHAIAFDKTRPMSDLRAGLPFSLQKIVDRCLEKDPVDRYPDMNAVVKDLQDVKRELDSGVTRSTPLLARFRPRGTSLRPKGIIFIVIWGLILLSLAITSVVGAHNLGPAIPFVVVGAFVARHFLTRRQRVLRKFASRAGKEKAVFLVSAVGRQVLVVVDEAPAKTFLKLNSLFENANEALYAGADFDLQIRDDVGEDERKETLARPGLLYVDTKRDSRS